MGRRLPGASRLLTAVFALLPRERVRRICLLIIVTSSVLGAISFWTWDGNHTVFGPALGADYTGLYVAGRILGQGDAERLYDTEFQSELYHELLDAAPAEESLPYLYPPFFAAILHPLAQLSYAWSYGAWLALSVGLVLAGFALMWPSLAALPRGDRWLAVWLALSFEPLIMECWLGGQTSSWGFFCVAAAFYFQRQGRTFAAGLAWAGCLYKPTALVLILPLLVLTRCWRGLAGFAAGCAGLAGVSLLAVGSEACFAYVHRLLGFAQMTVTAETLLRTWKYVDFVSFVRLLEGELSPTGRMILTVGLPGVALLLAAIGRKVDVTDRDRCTLLWASALSWTQVCNLYVGVYDTILAVPGVLLTAVVLHGRGARFDRALPPAFQTLLVLLYAVPWFTQHLARTIGFQPLTLLLAALGAYQLWLASRSAAPVVWRSTSD